MWSKLWSKQILGKNKSLNICKSHMESRLFNGRSDRTWTCDILLPNSDENAEIVRKWSTQSREPAPWYRHIEMGYNYRMSNVIAGVIRGQLPYANEQIAQKKATLWTLKISKIIIFWEDIPRADFAMFLMESET